MAKQKDKIIRSQLIIIFILGIIMALLLFANITIRNENEDIEAGKAIVSNWACMDGCFWALCPVPMNINESCKENFDICAEKCSDKFIVPAIGDSL